MAVGLVVYCYGYVGKLVFKDVVAVVVEGGDGECYWGGVLVWEREQFV